MDVREAMRSRDKPFRKFRKERPDAIRLQEIGVIRWCVMLNAAISSIILTALRLPISGNFSAPWVDWYLYCISTTTFTLDDINRYLTSLPPFDHQSKCRTSRYLPRPNINSFQLSPVYQTISKR